MTDAVAGDGGDCTPELLKLVNDVAVVSVGGTGGGLFKKDCTDLGRRIALLTHLLEEMRDFRGQYRPSDESSASSSSSSSSRGSWSSDLMVALQAAKSLLLLATSFNSDNVPSVSFHFSASVLSRETNR